MLENRDIEVDQQANFTAGQPEISQKLGFVDRLKRFDGLELYDDRSFNDEVQPVTAIQLLPFVFQGQRLLLLKGQSLATPTLLPGRPGKLIRAVPVPNAGAPRWLPQ